MDGARLGSTPLYLGERRALITIARRDLALVVDTDDVATLVKLLRDDDIDPAVANWATRHVRSGWTCLDVGAGWGFTTSLLGRLAWQGHVHAWEADRRSFELLIQNVAANELFWIVRPTRARAGALPAVAPDGTPTLTVDLYLEQQASMTTLDLLRIGPRESATAVLDGAASTLRSSTDPHVLLEWSPNELRDAGRDPSVEISGLAARDFQPHVIDADGRDAPVGWAAVSTGGRLQLWLRAAGR
jgi:hypothetical protein